MSSDDAPLLAEMSRLLGRLESLLDRAGSGGLAFGEGGGAATAARSRDLLRQPRAALPDPRLIRRIQRHRRLRGRYFETGLFADPAWDILLELTAARAEHVRVCVSSLCAAAAVPDTTALRWTTHMTELGLLVRVPDDTDKRRVFITLADPVADAMARYFDELGNDAAKLI